MTLTLIIKSHGAEVVTVSMRTSSSTDIMSVSGGGDPSISVSGRSRNTGVWGVLSVVSTGEGGGGVGSSSNAWSVRFERAGSASLVHSASVGGVMDMQAGASFALDILFEMHPRTCAFRAADMGPVRIRAVAVWRWLRMGPETRA